MKQWKKYILSSVAGFFSLTQFTFIFFFSNEGFQILRYFGWIIWVISLVFGWMPIFVLARKGGVPKGKSYVHTTILVETGIYAIVRHPQYLALPLLNLALILIAQHWIIAIIGVVAIVLMYIDILNADQEGIDKFGNEYKRYMRTVPRTNFLLGIIRIMGYKNKARKC